MKKEQQHTKKTIFFIVTSILMTIYLTMESFLYTSISRRNFTSNIWHFVDRSRNYHGIYNI